MAFATAVSSLIKTALISLEAQFLETVAKDYNLPLEELQQKYKVTADATSLKRPYKRKATVEMVDKDGNTVEVKKAKDADDRPLCKGTTAKREPCKFHALKGGCYCKRHQEAFELEEARRSGKQINTQNKSAQAAGEPMHTHKPDGNMHDACDLCQSHGPALGEFKPVQATTLTPEEVNNRLKSIINNASKPLELEAFSESGLVADEESGDEHESQVSGQEDD
jgi:hypothetical protein